MLVALCGYAGVGKDTIADAMPEFTKLSFASALKADLQPLLRQVGIDLNRREDKCKVRDLLVEYGRTMRKLDPDYWVKKLEARYNALAFNRKDYVIITDLRYLNEAEWVHNNGGVVVRVGRYGVKSANNEEYLSINKIDASCLPSLKLVNDNNDVSRTVARLRHLLKGAA